MALALVTIAILARPYGRAELSRKPSTSIMASRNGRKTLTTSNWTAHPNRRRFLHGAASLGVAGALPAIRTPPFAAHPENLVPKQHYLIAFSIGDMNNPWRAAFVT